MSDTFNKIKEELSVYYPGVTDETDEMLANIAEIAVNVGKFLKSPIISQKRDILNLILSDCKTEGKNLCFSIRKPFDKLLKTPEINKWCTICYISAICADFLFLNNNLSSPILSFSKSNHS